MTSLNRTQMLAKINKLERARAYAWGQYYAELEREHEISMNRYITVRNVVEMESCPQHIISEMKEMYKELKKEIECPVCMEIIPIDDLKFTKCGHKLCKECYDCPMLTKCPMCRKDK